MAALPTSAWMLFKGTTASPHTFSSYDQRKEGCHLIYPAPSSVLWAAQLLQASVAPIQILRHLYKPLQHLFKSMRHLYKPLPHAVTSGSPLKLGHFWTPGVGPLNRHSPGNICKFELMGQIMGPALQLEARCVRT